MSRSSRFFFARLACALLMAGLVPSTPFALPVPAMSPTGGPGSLSKGERSLRAGLPAQALRPSNAGMEESSVHNQLREKLETPAAGLEEAVEEQVALRDLVLQLFVEERLVKGRYLVQVSRRETGSIERSLVVLSFAGKKLLLPPYFRTDREAMRVFRDRKGRYLVLVDAQNRGNLVVLEQRQTPNGRDYEILSATSQKVLVGLGQRVHHLTRVPEFQRFYSQLRRNVRSEYRGVLGIGGKMHFLIGPSGNLQVRMPPTKVHFQEGPETNIRQVVDTTRGQTLLTLRRRGVDEVEVAYGDLESEPAFVVKGGPLEGKVRYFHLWGIIMALKRLGLEHPVVFEEYYPQREPPSLAGRTVEYLVNRTREPWVVHRAEDVPRRERSRWERLDRTLRSKSAAGLEEPPVGRAGRKLPAWIKRTVGDADAFFWLVASVHGVVQQHPRVAVLFDPELIPGDSPSDKKVRLMALEGNVRSILALPDENDFWLGFLSESVALKKEGYRVVHVKAHPESRRIPLVEQAIPLVALLAVGSGQDTFWVNPPVTNAGLEELTLPEVVTELTNRFT